MKRFTSLVLVVVLGLLAVACDNEDAELTTTTTVADGDTGTDSTTSTTEAVVPDDGEEGDDGDGDGGTEEPVEPEGTEIEDYDVIVTQDTDNGTAEWVLVADAEYTTRNLENLVVEVIEAADGRLAEFYVFDDREAIDAFLVAEADRTPEQQELVDNHFLVSVTEGTRVTFQGPFADSGGFIVGS